LGCGLSAAIPCAEAAYRSPEDSARGPL